MPLNSVQHYVHDLINNMVLPSPVTGRGPLDCAITPPALQSLDGPHCYVWGGHVDKERQTMPRGAGFSKYPWRMSIWLIYETSAQLGPSGRNPNLDSEFPVLLDAVTKLLARTTMPILITDPDTGDISQIQGIGESWSLDYPAERLPATMRMLLYTAEISMDVLEVFQQ